MRLKSTISAGPHLQPLGREFGEQGDGIVVQLPPADGVEVAKEVDDLVVPTPPKVPGQGDAFFVERFRRKPIIAYGFTLDVGYKFDLAHNAALVQKTLGI